MNHLWIGNEATGTIAGADLTIDAHRRLRGPFTAAGQLVRELIPPLLAERPELVQRHDIEVLAVAPELGDRLRRRHHTLTSAALPEMRTRFYPGTRTVRIAHGLIDLIVEARFGRTVVVHHADEADPTDTAWLAGMLRRVDPAVLRLVICTAGDPAEELLRALRRHAVETAGAPVAPVTGNSIAAYLDSDCLSADPGAENAYDKCPPESRKALHDARADALIALGEPSLRRGAVCFHRERGSDPAGAGVEALAAAQSECLMAGFYDAVIDLGRRVLALADWKSSHDRCWLATVAMTIAYAATNRPDDAMALYDDACAHSTAPFVHMQSAYGRAMLYTRYLDVARRDDTHARAWANTAIALAGADPDERRRVYNTTFQQNGLALVAMHEGDGAEALALIDAAIERMARTFPDGERALHLSVLRYNRAQLLGRVSTAAAIEAYTEVIAEDPFHPDYLFDRAALLRKAGRYDEALTDYAAAIAADVPYPEPYYNRGDLLLALGDAAGATGDFDRALELDPEFVSARIARATLRYESGDPAGAAADVAAGLETEAEQAHLLCLRGLLALDEGRLADADADLRAALDREPGMAGAWSNLGVVAFSRGDAAEAVRCFDRALELEDDPDVRDNRSVALAAR